MTTFDDLPGEFVAGTSYSLGYTIRQHGTTPVNVEHTEIAAIAPAGQRIAFPGSRDGATGHYRATIVFPREGSYRWEVTQTPFGPQDLGTVTVVTAASSLSERSAANLRTTPSPDPFRSLVPFAAAAAVGLFGWRLLTVARAPRRGRPIA